ncbi:MAG: T9SS type A sorting domain-containing protein, partial [Cloacibacterium sp.]|nr:T9SS type A sorting domain-containing protein [Cloacibacterium sp.]
LAFSIIGETNLGTSEVYNNGIFIYQNDGFLNLESKTTDKISKTTIIDFTGKEILSSKEMKIYIATLPKGAYFAKIEREGKRDIVYKFIKN